MSDNSREHFESWWSKQTSIDPYIKGEMWDAWQASRAAIEIELPKSTEFGHVDLPGYVIDRCASMIAAQGLKVKA